MTGKIASNLNIKQDITFLICAVFTIAPYDKVFKHLNKRRTIGRNRLKQNLKLSQRKFLDDFLVLLNKNSLRTFAYTLVVFLLDSKSAGHKYLNSKKLLKQYLKKYNYFYTNYFETNSNGTEPFKNKKEINTLAINALFIIVGI
jgi:hypothetical protein